MNKCKVWKMTFGIILIALVLSVKSPVFVYAAEEELGLWMEEIEVESFKEDLPAHELSAPESMLFTLDANGQPVLSTDRFASWYERLDSTAMPDYAKEFHDWLLEHSDGDSINNVENPCATDWLIDPTKGEVIGGNTYVYEVHRFEWTVDFNGVPAIDGDYEKGINEYLDSVATPIKEANYAEARAYVSAVYQSFDRDYPQVFWLDGTSMVGYASSRKGFSYTKDENGASGSAPYTQVIYFYLKETDSESQTTFDLRADDYRDVATIKSTIEARDTKVTEIINSMNSQEFDTVYEKVKYLNDWLTNTNAYNNSANLNTIVHDCRECTSALFGNSGAQGPVCEAYARAFKVLCDKVGITCTLVSGDAFSGSATVGEPHMWNLVADEASNYYAVDVTWNDPMLANSDNTAFVSGVENRKYLMVGSETVIGGKSFEASHVTTNRVSTTGVAFLNQPETQKNEYAYNVKFLLNNGTNEYIESYAPLGGKLIVPDFSLVQYDGYRLIGFNTNINGTGTTYTLQELSNGTLILEDDIELFAVWEEVTVGETLQGYQISLDGNINLKYYFTFDDTLLANQNAYVEITLPNKTTQQIPITSLPLKDVIHGGVEKQYYEIVCEVAAKEMASDIKVVFVADEEQKSREYIYTVKDYAEDLIDYYKNTDEKLVNLVNALLNYGAYAQKYFGFNTGYLANEKLDAAMQSETYFQTILDNPKNYFVPMELSYPEVNQIGTFTKANLTLETLTTLNVYFKPADGVSVEDLSFTLNGTTSLTPVQTGADGEYLLKVSDIKAQKLGDTCEFVVTLKEDNTDKATLSYNALAYGYNMVTGTYKQDIKNLCAALYEYYSCAKTYVQSK